MNIMLSAIVFAGGGLVGTLVFLLIVGICLGIVWYLIGIAPLLAPMFKQVLQWLVVLFGALILINALLGLTGHPIVVW